MGSMMYFGELVQSKHVQSKHVHDARHGFAHSKITQCVAESLPDFTMADQAACAYQRRSNVWIRGSNPANGCFPESGTLEKPSSRSTVVSKRSRRWGTILRMAASTRSAR
mmetsp:Transcript_8206/g.24255  ORF Transcript_8206/g.24255 Transcript_8206/m.24255 type:complete len:110 (-) Transcript_8206:1082-1411(-)